MTTRNCWQCGAPIAFCNGFVGGDLAALMRGEQPAVPVVETCWKCAERYAYAKENNLPLPFRLPSEVPAI